MRHSISISLTDTIFKQLKSQCKKEGSNGSELIRQALREYFFRSSLSNIRKKAMIETIKQKMDLTEEEIFKQIS